MSFRLAVHPMYVGKPTDSTTVPTTGKRGILSEGMSVGWPRYDGRFCTRVEDIDK